ncbi:hypothetical protein QBC40DRAFT_262435 [Triangularia verruculosa]|uniref:Uncharacterized protein n=1 Tax=Triangularia verruculosa TaxID=2587418 RepID=A0AAN6XQL7_9PEZI|nr:hypothetical protein QBC40DRAFT_262435 [Triangularia verruculosa]
MSYQFPQSDMDGFEMIRQEIEKYRLTSQKLLDYLRQVFPAYANHITVETNKKDVYIAHIPEELTEEEVDYIDTYVRTPRRSQR